MSPFLKQLHGGISISVDGQGVSKVERLVRGEMEDVVCVYICIYVCIYTHIYVCMYMYIYIYVHAHMLIVVAF